MTAIITFIIVFGLIVLVHEFGHYYWAKRSGILVRQFSIGMGPKLVSYTKNHTLYTIRLLPLGGYVMMAGLEDDDADLKPGTVVRLKLNEVGVVECLDCSGADDDATLIPLQVTQSDLQEELFITGYLQDESETLRRFEVDHDAVIVDQNRTALQIAPRDVQFNSASLLNRFLTNLAGPFNNIVFGILVSILGVFLLGGAPSNSNQVGTVTAHSPAAQAQLKPGERILQVNHKKINSWTQLSQSLNRYPKQKVQLKVQDKQKKIRTVQVRLNEVRQGGQRTGQLGITESLNSDLGATFKYGLYSAGQNIMTIIMALKQMVTGGFNLNQLGGPVAIYSETSQVAALGWKSVVLFIAWLSINLGIMNLLPIPALDGGKLLLNLIEALRRKPVSPKTEMVINLVGVGFLLLLMVAVTWNDITRFFIK
ncbi:RIP metalloprotease RseP [Lactobacillus sp. DCY120]|uniref:Zinc metalloprotease n=1 Tax=Bombilactobacillus apium TaxID=2675299 RepID=A0A850RE86_9LACO|nr:RIP metalloprotease RseP [Bombilactobacillus apium]NVY97028.1 RIP metalloprotease RseP [Bombilactobacillus apium]